jgi:hypothetical protein
LLDRLLAEAAVPAELDVRDVAGARLRPHPVLRYAEALGDVVHGQQAGHRRLSRWKHPAGNPSAAETAESEN